MKKMVTVYYPGEARGFGTGKYCYEVGETLNYDSRNFKLEDIVVTEEKVLRFELDKGGFVCFFGIPFKYVEVPIN